MQTRSRDHPANSRYKGVVPQSNRKWRAQIGEGEKEIRLGTFDTEDEAARAYDRALLKYVGKPHKRGRMSILRKEEIEKEIKFQAMYTKENIVEMIKHHSYDENLRSFAQTRQHQKSNGGDIEGMRELLFSKNLTKTDIKQRLGIPKDDATRCFPLDGQQNGKQDLVFKDEKGESWKFGYSCFKNQKYVLNKGWKEFVYDKNLKVGDILCCERCQSGNILTVKRQGETSHGRSVQPQGETSHRQSVQLQGESSHVQSLQFQSETSHGQPQGRETSHGQLLQPQGETSHDPSMHLQDETSHTQSVSLKVKSVKNNQTSFKLFESDSSSGEMHSKTGTPETPQSDGKEVVMLFGKVLNPGRRRKGE